ncbi:MAG: DUF4097 family beta strand repeat protein [Actinobacteria bacterium]|nr:DUF4097 family beta strand repeat protein [Actinomycetota bacterium]
MNTKQRTEQFQVGERTSLDIEVRTGAVEVRAGAAGRASAALDGDRADEWDVTQLGDSLSIQPADRRGSRARTIRVLVEVPIGSDVEVRTVSADVTLGGSLGTARVHTVSGDVRVDTVSRLDLNCVSGDLAAGSVGGDASVTTVSGDVTIRKVAGRLNVSTASGDLRVAHAADDVTIGTASGDVRVDRTDGASVVVRSLSGDVTVGLPAGIRVEPDISTLSGRTTLPAPSGAPPTIPPRIVRVRLRAVSGNITIVRVARD